jgi:prophage regulatory protein
MEPKPIRFLRLPEVKRRTGLAKTAIYERIEEGAFPGRLIA